MAKTFGLWAGQNYYPGPGLEDFQGFYETVEEAKIAKPERCEWAEVNELVLWEDEDRAPEWETRSYWPTYEYNSKGMTGTADEWSDNG